MRGEGGTESRTKATVGVLSCNETAVQVFQSCQWNTQSDAAGLIWLGIASTELVSAMENAGVPTEDRQEVALMVRIMERAAYKVHADRRAPIVSKLNSKGPGRG